MCRYTLHGIYWLIACGPGLAWGIFLCDLLPFPQRSTSAILRLLEEQTSLAPSICLKHLLLRSGRRSERVWSYSCHSVKYCLKIPMICFLLSLHHFPAPVSPSCSPGSPAHVHQYEAGGATVASERTKHSSCYLKEKQCYFLSLFRHAGILNLSKYS